MEVPCIVRVGIRWAVKHTLGASQTDTRDSCQPQNIKDNNNNVRKHIHQQLAVKYELQQDTPPIRNVYHKSHCTVTMKYLFESVTRKQTPKKAWEHMMEVHVQNQRKTVPRKSNKTNYVSL